MSCCVPSAGDARPSSPPVTREQASSGPTASSSPHGPDRPAYVAVPAGTFRMGNEATYANRGDGEGPVHEVDLDEFRIDAFTVSNDRYAAFVAATGHITEAERYGWSFVFAGSCPTTSRTRGAWPRPRGGGRSSAPIGPIPRARSRPSAGGATTRSSMCRGRTPSRSAPGPRRGCPRRRSGSGPLAAGGEGRRFPWGDDLEPEGVHRMNVFQGQFPGQNTLADGYAGTAPVDAFAPNDLGLFNTTGNVWEWCQDWYESGYYGVSPRRSPGGPASGTQRVMRGGSYLCHASYCNRYRVDARHANTPDSSTGNLGFRIVAT